MRLHTMLIRHYKSFNYDYELKARQGAAARAWEETAEGWYPFIRIPLDPDVTAVVGANESGKSHLLDAIEVLLAEREHVRRDFCRHSTLYTVEHGQRRYPDFAGIFEPTAAELTELRRLNVPLQKNQTVLLWKAGPDDWRIVNKDDAVADIDADSIAAVRQMLPETHRLHTRTPLPDALSIQALAGQPTTLGRFDRSSILQTVLNSATADGLAAVAATLAALTQAASQRATSGSPGDLQQQRLGSMLLQRIAKIDSSVFSDLAEAVHEEREGEVNALVQKMNESLTRYLNLAKWWRQDSSFSLHVSPREHELVFTISDRTGADYSFGERSTGLRYFLSYLIQLLAHPHSETRPEILLLDEPDTYLSASGQQDLLHVIEEHVRPGGQSSGDAAVYVTHSPFLINRNAAHRIRVLDKGSAEEGTRVVNDASKNRYEPLRSSIGAFVAETAFIGGANLFVEGVSDQVYLAGFSTYLRRIGVPDSALLDLNEITVVPAGSASSIPYMLYQARAQGEVSPPCAVLLDSGEAGEQARKRIKKGGAYEKPLIPEQFVTLLGEWATDADLRIAAGVEVKEIEDLIPVKVAVASSRAYAKRLLGASDEECAALTEQSVLELIPTHECSLMSAAEAAFKAVFHTTLEKVGFSKQVLQLASTRRPSGNRSNGVLDLEHNFGLLLAYLAEQLRQVIDEESGSRRASRIRQLVTSFLRDHPDGATRDRANTVLRQIDNAAGDSFVAEDIRAAVNKIRRQFALFSSPLEPVDRYNEFAARLKSLEYAERLAFHDAHTYESPNQTDNL